MIDFNKEAATWDAAPKRVKLAQDVTAAIIRTLQPAPHMDALDFGCGTGLVTLGLQPLVKSITGVDSSPGMLAALDDKVKKQGLANVRTRLVDFEKGEVPEGRFHLLVSSMTMHHVKDTAALLKLWYDLLLPGGLLGVADLDTEDGSFHGEVTGVYHLGFDRARLQTLLEDTGFHQVRATTATSMVKEIAGEEKREFSIFLITGRK